MLQFKIPDKQYILSLDSLDLSLLSQYVHNPNDEARVLWSKSKEDEPAFYQVEIVSEEQQDDDPLIEPYKSYLCYICNIDVPQKYYKQHNKSARHQNYKKLVEKVLENVAKQINIDVDNVSNNEENETFYCEPCCKVVAMKNKRTHKKSNCHLKSIEDGQLTSKFLEMYINNKDIPNDVKSENYLDSESSSMLDTDWWCHSDASENEHTKNYNNNSVAYKRNESANSMSLPFNEFEELENFKQYLKEMIAKFKLDFKLPTVEDNSVIIVTPKGYKEPITKDAFHSYKEMDGFAFCLLCQKWVQENTIEHSASEEHVTNIFQPINDNFAREVVYDNKYSHCLICNERVLTASNHVNVKPKHQKYSQLSAPNSNECDRNPESLSDLKNGAISNEEPSESNSSKTAFDSSLSRINTDIETAEQKLIEYRKQFSVLGASKLKCLVCPSSNFVPNVDNNIIEHIEGRLHRHAFDILLFKNGSKKISLTLYYCNLCNQFINDFINHINSQHKPKPIKCKLDNKKLLKNFAYDPLPYTARYKAIDYNFAYDPLPYTARYRAIDYRQKYLSKNYAYDYAYESYDPLRYIARYKAIDYRQKYNFTSTKQNYNFRSRQVI